MSEPLIEDDEFWQGVVDATDCILSGRVIEAICTALDRRAAPDEASRAPAPEEQPARETRNLTAPEHNAIMRALLRSAKFVEDSQAQPANKGADHA